MKSDTYEKLPDAMRWLAERGVMRAHLWFVSLTDGNADNVESMPKMTEVVPKMAEALDEASRLGMDVWSLHVPRCLLGRLFGRRCALLSRSITADGGVVHGEDHGADLDLVAFLDVDFLDRARDSGRHLDGGLVGLQFQHWLIAGDRVARIDHHTHDVAAGDVLAQFGHFELSHTSAPTFITIRNRGDANAQRG
jgi:hypothetical protein